MKINSYIISIESIPLKYNRNGHEFEIYKKGHWKIKDVSGLRSLLRNPLTDTIDIVVESSSLDLSGIDDILKDWDVLPPYLGKIVKSIEYSSKEGSPNITDLLDNFNGPIKSHKKVYEELIETKYGLSDIHCKVKIVKRAMTRGLIDNNGNIDVDYNEGVESIITSDGLSFRLRTSMNIGVGNGKVNQKSTIIESPYTTYLIDINSGDEDKVIDVLKKYNEEKNGVELVLSEKNPRDEGTYNFLVATITTDDFENASALINAALEELKPLSSDFFYQDNLEPECSPPWSWPPETEDGKKSTITVELY